MAKPIDALEYLAHPEKQPIAPIVVLFGDESFLKRLALVELRKRVLGSDDGEFSLATFTGKEAQWRDVLAELSTMALFGGGQRLVVVEDADQPHPQRRTADGKPFSFVSGYRPALEDYAAKPKATAVLVLDVKSWPATTRLYKALSAGEGLQIECKIPAGAKLLSWLTAWAQRRHQAKLAREAAEMLVELVEPELGLFDQELAKLAALAGVGGTITADMVAEAVGSWRVKTTWDMLDAAAGGDARAALVQLDRLLLSGEHPVALLGQIGYGLRNFAAATRLVEQAQAANERVSLRQVLEQVGVKPFLLGKAETQLKQIGRQRGGQLYHWLLKTDLALKGTSSSPTRARLALEELIVRLSKANAPQPAGRKAVRR